MRIVCVSDTHGMLGRLRVPDGDVLVHAGDLSEHGTAGEVEDELAVLEALPHAHKIVIAGNHDFALEEGGVRVPDSITYLQDSGVTIDGLVFWGSPWQPYFGGWAFNLRRGAPLREVWARVPTRTDVLVTHTPPLGMLDRVLDDRVGCEELRKALVRIAPRLHVFGHIHEGYGTFKVGATQYVNAACMRRFAPNAPIVVVLADL